MKKYIPNVYSMFDTCVLARKLEKMARKGWHFKEIIPYFLVFEEGEAMEVAYSTAFFPNNSVLEPKLTEDHEAYLELCEQQGWELIWTHGTRQIFRNTRPDPVPIETDTMVQLQAIGASTGRYLFKNFAPLLICLPILFVILNDYKMFGDVSDWFKTWELQMIAAMFFLPAILGLVQIAWYFIWFSLSHNCVKKGLPMLPTLFYPRLVLNIIGGIPFICILVMALSPLQVAVFLALALPLDLLWWRYFQKGKKFFKSKEQVYIFFALSQLLIFEAAEELVVKIVQLFP